MYGYGYKINSGLVLGAGGGAPFANTYSLDYDGIDDFVSTNSKIIGSDITLSGWVNFNGSYSVFSAHFPMSITPSNLGVGNETLGRFYKNGSKLQIAIQCNDNTGANFSTYFVDSTTLEGAGWQHICLTYNVTTGHIYAYLNGVAQNWVKIFAASTPVPFLTAVSGRVYESNLTIGRLNPTTSTGTFLGLVDEVSTYDKILTQAEITSISAAPSDLTNLSPTVWLRNGDNGSYKSPQWLIPNNENKDKVSNYSFDFDGIDDYINIGNAISFEYNDAFSYSFWINPDSDSGVKYLFSKYASSRGILIYLNSSSAAANNTLNFNLYNIGSGTPSGRKYITTNSTNMALPNEWTNIVITYDGSGLGSGISFYKNGVAQSVTVTNDSLASNTILTSQNAYISGNNFASSFYPGKQDEWAIFNTELSSADALAIYNSGEPTTLPSGAVAHYKMGEDATFSGGVWTVPDSAGSNNGTSNGMTIEDRVGDAPNSTSNALSYNMDEVDRVEDTP